MGLIIALIIGTGFICVWFLEKSYKKNEENGKNNPMTELQNYREKYGLSEKIPCSKEDNEKYAQMVKDGTPLPTGVYAYNYENLEDVYYTIQTSSLATDELFEMLTYKILGYLRTIKNCAVYFVVLSVISLCVYLIFLLQTV